VAFTGAAVALRDGLVSATITGSRNDAGRDLAAQPYTAGEAFPYKFDVANTSPLVEKVVPTAGNFSPLVPDGPGNCRYSVLPAGQGYTCATPWHTVTAEEAAQGFFIPQTSWDVSAAGQSTRTYAVNGGEVDLKVRDVSLDGTVAAVWTDKDGDRYASAGDVVTYSYTLGNAGNVPLTGVAAPDAGISEPSLAAGSTVTATRDYVLTTADIAAGKLDAVRFNATGDNGTKRATVSVSGGGIQLELQPAQPETEPALTVQDFDGQAPPFDLKTQDKYRNGQKVVLEGLDYGQWYYVYLNKRSQRIGWLFPTTSNTVEFILPAGVQNGRDDVVVLDKDGKQVSFDRLLVTPKG
jgi:sialidase-1